MQTQERLSVVTNNEADAVINPVQSDYVLEVQNLSLKHKDSGKYLLRDVSFSVGNGQIIGVIGNSGSGKSLLLESMIRIHTFQAEMSGSVEFYGKNLLTISENMLDRIKGNEISYIPTGGKTYLNPVVSIGKQLSQIIMNHSKTGKNEAAQKVMEWLVHVSIPDPLARMSAYPHELSGGMAQRAIIAAAMLNKPKLILADEPTAGLDVTVQRQILDLMSSIIRETGISCLLVTRDLGIVANYCDSILVLDEGKVAEENNVKSFFHSTYSLPGKKMLEVIRREAVDMENCVIPQEEFNSTVIRIEKLSKIFKSGKNKINALNGVSFSIEQGETLSIVGESGSGKTTVGRCIAGLVEPTKGKIHFPSGIPQIGMVFQEPFEALNPRHSIRKILSEPLILIGINVSRHEPRILEVLDIVNLPTSILRRYPFELRPNEQQRVGIARALMNSPRIILLDEPTSMLDAATRLDILQILKKIQKETGISYLFISHDLPAVKLLSHRIAVMYLGEIVEIGFAEDIFREPLHPYTQSLLSSMLLADPGQGLQEMKLKNEIPSPINLPKGCYLAPRCAYAMETCQEIHPSLLQLEKKDRKVACHLYTNEEDKL